MSGTIWICGTSASISAGCYADRLPAFMPEVEIRNISVGDQTSIMGLMRIHQHAHQIKPGDVVVWEYPLLDELLSPFFGTDVILDAMRQAWSIINDRHASIFVLITPPRENIEPSANEILISNIADQSGIPVLSLRELVISENSLASYYRDDRHPDEKGDLPEITALCLSSRIRYIPNQNIINCRKYWRWIDAEELIEAGAEAVPYTNQLLNTMSARFSPGAHLSIPKGAEIISVGIISTNESGALWCGHQPCAPAGCKTAEVGFKFLLRSTRIPCVRGTIEKIISRPDYYNTPSWQDYGQATSNALGPVDIFGLLIATR